MTVQPPRPRLLILTPRLPYPMDKGDRVRIYNVCAELSRSYRLTLLSLCESQQEYELALPADGVFESVERVLLPAWKSRLNCIAALPTRTPLQVAYYRSSEFERRVAQLLAQHDAVLCHLVRTAEYALDADVPRILEMTDAISMNYRRMKLTPGSLSLRKLIFRAEQERLESFERSIVDAFDVAVLVADTDRQFLFADEPARLAKTIVCSNGVDCSRLPYQFAEAPSGRIVFIGNMTTVPNLDAVEWFARTALPLIRARHQAAVLDVIGYIEPPQRNRLEGLPGVNVVGGVASVAAAARGAAVAVCPIRLGAGVQNKLLEYMALGLPSVTTSIGLEGFGARAGEDLLVADEPEQIAASVCKLLEDRATAHRLSEAARHYVESHHRWSDQIAPLVRAIDASLAHRGRLASAQERNEHANRAS